MIELKGMIIIDLFVLAFGAILGSFGALCVVRIPKTESIISGSSHCDNCGRKLKWYELIPIFSYLFLKGRCASCGHKISKMSFVFEILSCLLSLMCYKSYGFSFNYLLILLFIIDLLVISFIDYYHQDIYLKTIIVLAILAIIYRLYNGGEIKDMLIGTLAISLSFAIVNLFKKDSFGFGDVELMAVAGFLLGIRKVLIATYIGIITAGVVAIYLLYLKKTKAKHIAFAPFLSLGIIISLFFGDFLYLVYLGLF